MKTLLEGGQRGEEESPLTKLCLRQRGQDDRDDRDDQDGQRVQDDRGDQDDQRVQDQNY